MTTIWKDFRFEAAHQLPNVPPGHKCGRMHGHSYRVHVVLSGDPDPETGWIVDFDEIKAAWRKRVEHVDHSTLNEIRGLENPTAENFARWIWHRLRRDLPQLSRVEVWETETCGAAFEGR